MGRNNVARKAKPVDFISHDPLLIEAMKFSSQEFYARVENALAVRQIPNASVTRVDWKEGGPLSARREYLRVQRERFVFDVCAAPFGTGFFVSVWCAERPLRIGLLMWISLILGFGAFLAWMNMRAFAVEMWLMETFNLSGTGATVGLFGILLAAFLGTVIIVGSNLDLFMIGVPVIGVVYEKYFRKITYYRTDMMCMYRTAVRAAVKESIDEITKAQGISPPSEFEHKPIMRELQPQGANGHD